MPVNVKIISTRDFVKMTAAGTLDFAASSQAILDIASLITTPGEYEVLVDTRDAEAHLTIPNIYELGVALASHPSLRVSKIALLAPITEAEKARFFETVALNRGVRLTAFSDFEAAITWLVMKDPAPSR